MWYRSASFQSCSVVKAPKKFIRLKPLALISLSSPSSLPRWEPGFGVAIFANRADPGLPLEPGLSPGLGAESVALNFFVCRSRLRCAGRRAWRTPERCALAVASSPENRGRGVAQPSRALAAAGAPGRAVLWESVSALSAALLAVPGVCFGGGERIALELAERIDIDLDARPASAVTTPPVTFMPPPAGVTGIVARTRAAWLARATGDFRRPTGTLCCCCRPGFPLLPLGFLLLPAFGFTLLPGFHCFRWVSTASAWVPHCTSAWVSTASAWVSTARRVPPLRLRFPPLPPEFPLLPPGFPASACLRFFRLRVHLLPLGFPLLSAGFPAISRLRRSQSHREPTVAATAAITVQCRRRLRRRCHPCRRGAARA